MFNPLPSLVHAYLVFNKICAYLHVLWGKYRSLHVLSSALAGPAENARAGGYLKLPRGHPDINDWFHLAPWFMMSAPDMLVRVFSPIKVDIFTQSSEYFMAPAAGRRSWPAGAGPPGPGGAGSARLRGIGGD
jgi:hypothetical protein